MANRTKPSIGRVLLFWEGNSNQDQPRAATVAYVDGDSSVNLGYLNSFGESKSARSVPLIQCDDIRPENGPWCEWMQYQVKPDYQQRAIDEKKELDINTAKLTHFISTPDFMGLDDEDKELLRKQKDQMNDLSSTLGKRIKRF